MYILATLTIKLRKIPQREGSRGFALLDDMFNRGVSRAQSNIYDGAIFVKIAKTFN